MRLDVHGPATARSVLDALEESYPVLRGTIRDQGTAERRDFIRFFAWGKTSPVNPSTTRCPNQVSSGEEPFRVVGAMAGG